MAGGGGSSTSFVQSPEQRAMFRSMQPLFQQTIQRGMQGQGAYDIPEMGAMPDYSRIMPTEDFFGSIDPAFKESLLGEFDFAREQTMNFLSGYGQAGSARGGASGAAGAAMGKLGAEQSKMLPQQLYGMMAPLMRDQFQAEQMRNQNMFGAELSAMQMPYSFLGEMSGLLPTPVVDQGGGGGLGGAITGGLAGFAATNSPWGAGAGAIGGFIG